jgi:hypothetical protein
MNILRRGVPASKETGKEGASQSSVNRRIEVTVERETITMLVRAHPVKNPDAPAQLTAGPELHLPELPPAE